MAKRKKQKIFLKSEWWRIVNIDLNNDALKFLERELLIEPISDKQTVSKFKVYRYLAEFDF